jgi:hypothetical protein
MSHYEPGDYLARIVRQGFSESKAKSTPFFFIEIEPIEALGANSLPSTIYKRSIDWYFTEKTIDNSIEKIRALGWAGTKLADLDPSSPNHVSFVGQEIRVHNQPDGQYDNFEMAREGSGTPGGGGGPKDVTGIASKLDKLFGKSLMATAKKAAPVKKQAPVGVGAEDDGVPF